MKHILGIDIGTNSIGWVLILEKKIIDKGVVIFPIGTNIKKGIQEETKNHQRGTYRRTKRNLFRYKLRRKDLKANLSKLSMLPDFLKLDNTEGYQAVELYKLRAEALNQQIPLEEIGRICLLINKHRGFKSNSKILSEISDNETSSDEKKEEGKVNDGIKELETFIVNSNSKTIGEYFYKMYEKSNQLFKEGKWHNINEPYDQRAEDEDGNFVLHNNRGIRRENGRYVSRKMYEIEFDLIWQKQKEFYPELTGSKKEYDEINKLPIDKKRIALKAFKQTAYWQIKHRTIFYQRVLKSQKKFIGKCQFEQNKRTAPISSILFQEFRIWKQLADVRYSDEARGIYNAPLPEEWKEKIVAYLEIHPTLSLRQTKNFKDKARKDDVMDVLGITDKKAIQFNFDNEDDDKVFHGNKTLFAIYNACGNEKYNLLKNENKLEKLWHILYMAKDDEWLKDNLIFNWAFKEDTANNLVEMGLEEGFANYSSKVLKKILPFMKEGKDEFDALVLANYEKAPDEVKEEIKLKEKISILKNNELRNPVVEKAVNQIIKTVNSILAFKEFKIDQDQLEINIESTREFKKPKKEREKIRRGNNDVEKNRIAYANFLNEKRKEGKLSFKREIQKNDSIINKFELWLEMGYDKNDPLFQNINIPKEKHRLWLECNRVCPYSGEIINLTTLFSPETEIEHIIPYSKSLDDSFANKTITFSHINKEKGNDIPIDYFKKKRTQADFNAFKQRIKTFSNFSKEKIEKRFLLEKVEYDFTNAQYPNTSYIAKYTRKKMLEVCRDVLFTNGAATFDLRKNDWQLGNLLDKIRFEEETNIDIDFHLGNFKLYKKDFAEWRKKKYNSTDLPQLKWSDITADTTKEYEDKTSNPLFYTWEIVQKFNEYRGTKGKKDRSDHRHHLLDAIITACCSRKIIQTLSTLNAQRETEGMPMYDDRGFLTRDRIECPLDYDEIKSALKSVLIFHQSEKRLITSRINKIKKKKSEDDNSNFIKQKTFAVRGSLFGDNFYGKLKNPRHQGFEKDLVFVKKEELTGEKFKDEKALEKIVDKNVQEILRQRLNKPIYGGNGEKAFSPEAIKNDPIYLYSLKKYPNGLTEIPLSKKDNPLPVIKKVRVANKNSRNLIQLIAKDEYNFIVNENRYAETDGNYVMALYEKKQYDKKGIEKKPLRDFEIVSFYEATNRRRKGEQLFPDEKNEIELMKNCPYLKAGDMVVMFEENEEEINWNDIDDLKKRLYKVVGMSSEEKYGILSFIKHDKSSQNASYGKAAYHYGDNQFSFSNRHTQLNAVKVNINYLGKIIEVGESKIPYPAQTVKQTLAGEKRITLSFPIDIAERFNQSYNAFSEEDKKTINLEFNKSFDKAPLSAGLRKDIEDFIRNNVKFLVKQEIV
ncbi:MAG: hypothetical protein M3Q58_11460 [Bacteroidota bacterium]|nr:hypothetical protein [Bacteroidota bacterium]